MREKAREKFVRLAEKRVNSVIKSIRLIGNLSNRSNYSYSDKDVEKIFNAISNEVKDCKNRFANCSSGEKGEFKLDE